MLGSTLIDGNRQGSTATATAGHSEPFPLRKVALFCMRSNVSVADPDNWVYCRFAHQPKGQMVGQQLKPLIAARPLGGTVLVVGNLLTWQKAGRKLPALPGFHFASFHDVTDSMLQFIAPELILSAVMGDDYDVVELARKLGFLGFCGRYRALTSGLPNPAMLLNEVANAAPQIDFDLFDLEHDFLK